MSLGIHFSSAQEYYNFEVKTNILRKSAYRALDKKDYYTSIAYFEKFLEKKPDNYKVVYSLAEAHRYARNYPKSAFYYQRAFELNESKNALAEFYTAEMNMAQGKYELAKELFTSFRKNYRNQKESNLYRKWAKIGIESCDEIINGQDQESNRVEHLSKDLNKAYNESSPFFYEDDIVFSSLRSDTLIHYNDSLFKDTSVYKAAFHIASLKGGEWKYSGKLNGPFISEDYHIGNGAVSPDGKTIYFTKCRQNWKYETICHIFSTSFEDGSWSEPVDLGENINQRNSTSSQPCLAIDPKNGREIMYFVSNRKDGRGGLDIYYSVKKKGVFGPAKNCGGRINTNRDEMTPYFDQNKSALYFSSSGKGGYGQMDVFRSFGKKSKWMKDASNLGKDINSPADDIYYIVKGEKAFFVSNRLGGVALKHPTCCDDLYEVKFGSSPVYEYRAVFKSSKAEQMEKLSEGDIQVFLRDPESGDTTFVNSLEIGEDGVFRMEVEKELDYLIIVEIPDHFITAFEIPDDDEKRDYKSTDTLFINPLDENSYVLENILYEFDDWKLTKTAEQAIDSFLLKLLILNPQVEVEISSHTDGKGSHEYNMRLSQRRAESVVSYLRRKGISSSRMSARGYGETIPIAENKNPDGSDNPEGRKLNRRTEFKVTGFQRKLRYKKLRPDLKDK